MCAIQHNL